MEKFIKQFIQIFITISLTSILFYALTQLFLAEHYLLFFTLLNIILSAILTIYNYEEGESYNE